MVLRDVTLNDGCDLKLISEGVAAATFFFIVLDDMEGQAFFKAQSESHANRIFTAFVASDLSQ